MGEVTFRENNSPFAVEMWSCEFHLHILILEFECVMFIVKETSFFKCTHFQYPTVAVLEKLDSKQHRASFYNF
jgi:hypothetical protein